MFSLWFSDVLIMFVLGGWVFFFVVVGSCGVFMVISN